jgi:hypothetical protein
MVRPSKHFLISFMRKRLVKEYDFELPGGRMVRFFIFQDKQKFWGRWDYRDKSETTEGWYLSVSEAMRALQDHATETLK